MFQHLTLEKPLVIIDLETTGVDSQRDRIVEISILKILSNGSHEQRTWRINPGMPIPAEATAVHGIRNEHVVDEPRFENLANTILAFIADSDLCGYNLKRFDLRVLYWEFKRAKCRFDMEGRAIIDPMEIFYHYEPRNLTSAVRRYLDREHEGGHSAAVDVRATAEVLDAMVARHPDLPRSIDGLNRQFMTPDQVDSDGFFRRVAGEIRFVKGKHRGEPLASIAHNYPDYLSWMLNQELFDDTKVIVRNALAATQRNRRTQITA